MTHKHNNTNQMVLIYLHLDKTSPSKTLFQIKQETKFREMQGNYFPDINVPWTTSAIEKQVVEEVTCPRWAVEN
jgi:hypothetical protein